MLLPKIRLKIMSLYVERNAIIFLREGRETHTADDVRFGIRGRASLSLTEDGCSINQNITNGLGVLHKNTRGFLFFSTKFDPHFKKGFTKMRNYGILSMILKI